MSKAVWLPHWDTYSICRDNVIGAAVFAEAVLLNILTAIASAAGQAVESAPAQIELIDTTYAPARVFSLESAVSRSRHRFRLELEGAHVQAEDWLHDAGFSLLEERDGDGRRGYTVISGALVSEGPIIRLRARFGQRQLPGSLSVRSEMPAIGITIPWRQYSAELEGVQDSSLGYVLMQSFHWNDSQRRVQWGLALPVAIRHGPSVGALLQLNVRLGG